jgi:hypothetical protein
MASFDVGSFVRVKSLQGMACWVVGLEMEEYLPEPFHDCVAEDFDPDDCPVCCHWGSDSEDWEMRPTGKLWVRMVGHDKTNAVDPDECEPIDEADFCSSCGQIGCRW